MTSTPARYPRDLLGHGRSDRPHDPTLHRFDLYAKQVVALLDHLEVRQAVIGGLSLGADVSLHVAADNYGVVEDTHQSLMHILAQYLRLGALPAEQMESTRF